MTVQCKNLIVSYGSKTILNDISLSIPQGQITTICGANGCGKSTLLTHLVGLREPQSGLIELDGEDISQWNKKAMAQRIAVLPQSPSSFADLSIWELAKLGRYPHQSFFQQWTEEDESIVSEMLEFTGLTSIKHQSLSTLSGGQKQRAWIALTLVQEADIIFLDEPINHLDVHHQIEIMDLMVELQKQGKTIVLVLHDLNLAARFSHNIIMLARGHIHDQGAPVKVITKANLKAVFDIEATIINDPVHDVPMAIAHSKHALR